MNHRGGEAPDAVERSNGARSHGTKWLKQRRLAKVTTAIATAAIVSAVGMGSATVANASVVNLTWWTMWSGSTLQLLNQMTTQFNKTHPGIHVTETNIPSVCHDEHRQAPVRRSPPATRPTSSPSGGPRSASSPLTATSIP